MSLWNSHLTDDEFGDWHRQHFQPLKSRVDAGEQVLQTISKKLDEQMAWQGKNDQRLQKTQDNLKRLDVSVVDTLEGLKDQLLELEKCMNSVPQDHLMQLFQNQLAQIDSKVVELRSLERSMIEGCREAKCNAEKTMLWCEDVRKRVTHLQDEVAEKLANFKGNADAAANGDLDCALPAQALRRSCDTFWGRLRWLLRGLPPESP